MNFQDYFQAYNGYFWQWEDETQVVAISGGSTIAYKQHLIDILQALSDDGIPPFGALLLVMISIADTVDDSVDFVENKIGDYLVYNKQFTHENSTLYSEALVFMKRLKSLPDAYKKGNRKIILLKTLFKESHRKIKYNTAKGLIIKLRDKAYSVRKLSGMSELKNATYFNEFNVLRLLERQFPTAQSIIDAMGKLPELEPEELPEMTTEIISEITYKDFVEELMDNDHTFQLGALIKPIWAGFKIPVFNALPSEQPLGGFSDISNKGDFDKLLVSEFANDDLVFMSRLANNEALYLHREMPPAADDLQRIILLDISLRMWGTPKTLAHAVYLAIAKHPKSTGSAKAFVVGNFYHPIFYTEVGAIVDGLQKVDVGLHAANGLQGFFKEYKNEKQLEIFYITTTESLRQPAIQKQMTENAKAFKYIITVSKEAEINFYRNKNSAHQHLQTIRLPLEKLWTKPKRIKHFIERESYIDNVNLRLPLLFAISKESKKMLNLGDEEVYCVAHRCLFKRSANENKKNSKGWKLVLKGLPLNGLFEVGRLANGEVLWLVFNPQTRELSLTNLKTLQNAKVVFKEWDARYHKEFLFDKDRFVHLHKNPNGYAIRMENDKAIFYKEGLSSIYYHNYNLRQEELQQIKNTEYTFNILQKLKVVYINANRNLMFNTHQLQMNGHENFFLSNIGNQHIKVDSKRIGNNEFKFPDGSIVKIDTLGVVSLISSNADIPTIFIPTPLSITIGLATENSFAGNQYYYNENLSHVQVYLENAGASKLMTVKLIKEYTGLGLNDAKDIVDGAPKLISSTMTIAQATKMETHLAKEGAVVSIRKPKDFQTQQILSDKQFDQKYLQPFINHIIHHAARN